MSFEAGLLEILVRMNLIEEADESAIGQLFHDSDVDQFDDFLLSEGIVEEENLLQALSEYYQVPAFDVIGYFFERHYVSMFPKELLLRNRIVPLEVDENIMVVVASSPDDPDLLVEIGKYVSYDIQFYVGIGRDICDAVKEFYDKADTQDTIDEDSNAENLLVSEFHLLENNDGEEAIVFSLDDEE